MKKASHSGDLEIEPAGLPTSHIMIGQRVDQSDQGVCMDDDSILHTGSYIFYTCCPAEFASPMPSTSAIWRQAWQANETHRAQVRSIVGCYLISVRYMWYHVGDSAGHSVDCLSATAAATWVCMRAASCLSCVNDYGLEFMWATLVEMYVYVCRIEEGRARCEWLIFSWAHAICYHWWGDDQWLWEEGGGNAQEEQN